MSRSLADLNPGESGVIERLDGPPDLVQRFLEFGLLEGDTVQVVALAPLGDPIEIRIGDTRLSLRKAEAAGVFIRDQASQ